MKLTYHKAVQREVDAACDWYDERKDRLGDEFFQEVERTLGLIALNPQAFPLAPFGRRKAHLNPNAAIEEGRFARRSRCDGCL